MEYKKHLCKQAQTDIAGIDESVRHVSARLSIGAEKLAAMDKKLAEFDAYFAAIDRRFAELNARFAAFNARYEAASEQISTLEKETQEACRMTQDMRRSTAYINARLEALEMAALAAEVVPQNKPMFKAPHDKDALH